MWNYLWGHELKESPGINCKSRVLYPGPRFLSSATWHSLPKKHYTVEPLLRGHPEERPPPLERPLDNVNLNINVLISTPDERPPLLKGHFSGVKGVASQEGFHYNGSINPNANQSDSTNRSTRWVAHAVHRMICSLVFLVKAAAL